MLLAPGLFDFFFFFVLTCECPVYRLGRLILPIQSKRKGSAENFWEQKLISVREQTLLVRYGFASCFTIVCYFVANDFKSSLYFFFFPSKQWCDHFFWVSLVYWCMLVLGCKGEECIGLCYTQIFPRKWVRLGLKSYYYSFRLWRSGWAVLCDYFGMHYGLK